MKYEHNDVANLAAELRRFSTAVMGGPHDRAAEVLLDLYDEIDKRNGMLNECRQMYEFKARENDSLRKKLNLKVLPLLRNTAEADMTRLIELHNEARARGGWLFRRTEASPLIEDSKLMSYAQEHANWMASNNRMRHSSMRDIMKLGFSRAGENIAWGQKTEESVMKTWLWSPGHRRNIMSAAYNKIGCGASKDKAGRLYWCVCFGHS